MDGELSGKIALVTGGAGDIGRAAALHLAQLGATVVAADLRPSDPVHNGHDSGGNGQTLPCLEVDVRQRASVVQMFTRLEETWGVPHIVLCNAGVVHNAHFLDVEVEHWEQTLAVNLTGSFHIAQEAARRMVAKSIPGKIVLTGSWVQDIPWADGSSYCTSKAGLKMLARCMARDLAPHGIRVNVVAPGIVDAGLSRQVMEADPLFRQRAARVIPLRELQTVEQVAQAIAWVCLPASDYMTGATLLVDGGCSLFYFE